MLLERCGILTMKKGSVFSFVKELIYKNILIVIQDQEKLNVFLDAPL